MAAILLIDDNDSLRKTLALLLERWGHTVRTATDGDEGLKLIVEQAPDIVITDIIMPNKEGLETIIQTRKIAPGVKILAMSGGSPKLSQDYLPAALRLGANAVLYKPFHPNTMKLELEKLGFQ